METGSILSRPTAVFPWPVRGAQSYAVFEFPQADGETLGVTVDVADEQSCQSMAAQTVQHFGRIDILVNNAAVYGGLKLTPFEQIPEAEWDRVMAVNVKGIWLCCKAVVPIMKQQGKGKIINISSDTIWMGVPLFLHYVASKGAVFALTRALARERASYRAPGLRSMLSPQATRCRRRRRALRSRRRLPASAPGSSTNRSSSAAKSPRTWRGQ
jgi:NAD(P)-dependent dehydrogenase (short-subunit alcohol dehydrogenase family)